MAITFENNRRLYIYNFISPHITHVVAENNKLNKTNEHTKQT